MGEFYDNEYRNKNRGHVLLERKRSWKVPSVVGNSLLELKSFAGVGKFRYGLKVLPEFG